ncbi:DNA polymerase III subunit gamma/tau [Agarivorans sp. B2Z047]|uniref:DNA polymerase III subunit gamma/tau n=1 Tax=Agarivorans sp. B2Z047 TaxID=2652721 RepID=UPI00128CC1E4|nr:DNA polymerase III subunit gamma/tau [Agarivorans sp. B2Z047]MPW29469.1 DNA polymerase III subunit gamma/tau [Agarivorans sp. B2Z047]UQN45058.1 DNA polymerase III subunit gamma/tau [Agarivorans sp. B2Z047]
MNYQALARKWRPRTFQQVVAQQHVLAGLINSLDQQRLHHAYLFSGTRGVGKTTIARLFAKSLNCEQGVSSNPCGKCSNCLEVDQGNFVDLLEIDAASRTKVEDTRELLDNVQYSPAKGRYKVYLIDEVHMLSRHSFNALLKTLEEPPEHVKFLLATTDPQKLPITVLSRCLQFQLKALSEEQISQQLAHILDAEQRQYQPAALNALAHAADGSMRDALSLTDQALALSNQELAYQQVLNMLGVLDPHQLRQLLCHVVAGQAESVFSKISELASMSPDYEHLHQQLAEIIHKVAMAQVLPASQHDETIQMLAEQVDAQLVQLLYQIVITGKRDFAYAPSPRSGFEMTVLRMLAFQPAEQGEVASPITKENSPSNADLADKSLVKEQQEILEQATQQGYEMPTAPAVSRISDNAPAPVDKDERVVQREQSIAKLKNQLRGDNSEQQQQQQQQQTKQAASSADVGNPAEQVATKAAAGSTPPVASHPAPSQTPPSSTQAAPQANTKQAVVSAEQATVDDSYYAQFADMNAEAEYEEPNYAVEYQAQDLPTAMPKATPVNIPQAPAKEETASLLQLRSQLRGRGKSGKKSEEAGASSNLKPNLAPANASEPSSNNLSQVQPETVEPVEEVETVSFVATTNDNDEAWSEMVKFMELGPIARQIAINSLYQLSESTVKLLLKPELSHLPKASSVEELNQQLSVCLQQEVELEITVGENSNGKTPLELAQLLHQKNTNAAIDRLLGDPNIQVLQQRFGAELDNDSVKYH